MYDSGRTRTVGERPLQRERHLVSVVIRSRAFQTLDYGGGKRVSRALAHGRVAH